MWYVRKYNPLFWDGKCCLDAVSFSDLSTEDNDISVWKLANDKSDIEDIALAMAMTRDKFNDFFIVCLDESKINALNLKMNPLPGSTRYSAMKNKHDNIVIPTFWEAGYLAEYIHEQLKNGTNIMYFSEPQLQDFLYKAVKQNKIEKSIIMNDATFKKYRKSLQDMEKIYGEI